NDVGAVDPRPGQDLLGITYFQQEAVEFPTLWARELVRLQPIQQRTEAGGFAVVAYLGFDHSPPLPRRGSPGILAPGAHDALGEHGSRSGAADRLRPDYRVVDTLDDPLLALAVVRSQWHGQPGQLVAQSRRFGQ